MQKLLQCLTIMFFLAVLLNESAFSANEQFRSIASGNWNANATWEMSTNGGSTWIPATSTPRDTSGIITVRSPNTVTVSVNVSADQLTVNTGGTLSISVGIVLTLLNGAGDDFTVLTGGAVSGAGTFQTQGTPEMNIRTGSIFSAAFKVNTGTVTVSEQSSPFNGKFFGSVTVDAGATLNTNTGSYKLWIYGNLTNNGTITGGSSSTVKFFGPSLANNGSITLPVFSFDSTSSVSGSGTYTGPDIIVTAFGNVSLLNNVTFLPSSEFDINNGGMFSANGNILTVGSGTFTIFSGGTVVNSGTIRTQGSVTLNPRTGSNFRATLNVNTGTTIASELSSPFDAKLFGNVSVDAGAVLNTNSGGYTLFVYGGITNNGTISGSGANAVRLYGPSLVNNGSITSAILRFDSTSVVSGSGTYTGADIVITGNGNVSLLNNVTMAVTGKLTINAGGIFSANTFVLTFTSGTFEVLSGGIVLNSGVIRTQNTVSLNLRTGSAFNAPLRVISGVTTASELSSPFNGRLFGTVTVDAGATLNTNNSSSYTLYIYGNLTNNGTLTGTNSNIKFYGPALANSGSVNTPTFNFDSTSTISGSGTWTGGSIIIGSSGNVSLLNNVNFSPSSKFDINTGGSFSANGNILTVGSGTFTIFSGGTVVNSGTIRTQGSVSLNPRTGSNFRANLNVNSGTTIAAEFSSPFNGRLYGSVTVDGGATLSSYTSSSYNLFIYGNLTNNGTLTGIGSNIEFYGPALTNSGSINTPTFIFDSTSTIAGTGTWAGGAIIIGGNGNVSLLNNVTFLPSSKMDINTGGSFSANSFIFLLGSGTMSIFTGATVVNSGTFRTQGTVTINPRTGSSFNANLLVNSGTTTVSELSSPFNAKLFGNITIDTGATMSTNNGGYTLFVFGNMTNNGAITGSGSDIEFQSGAHTLLGTGSISIPVNILSGAVVTLLSNHQMSSVNINTGGTFVTTGYILRVTASNPITQNGTFTNANSTVEYNGSALQTITTTNVTYHRLKINNSAGTSLFGNVSVNDTLSVLLGDLNLNGKILTISPIGYLTETAGNTVFGTSGYITTIRNINAPSSLNVGGLGAVLSTLANLGTTEIRRGHTIQTGLNGGTSIARYFDITPVNNSDLDATLVFKYDDSELNGKPESALKLFSSTNAGLTWSLKGGAPNTVTNSILVSKLSSFSRWSADTSGVSMVLNVAIEGFYNTVTNRLNMRDTVRAYFRNTSSPFAIVDSAKAVIDSLTFQGSFNFPNAPSGTYYIMIKHRNSIETWSRTGGEVYTVGNTLHYNFPLDSNKAYGNNQKFVGTKWTIFSGDVNQNGIINLTDILLVSNAASSFSSGYVVTDVNGDRVTNLTDIIFTSNNSNLFVTKETP